MKFVVIEPSKKNTIKNNETLVLKEINTFDNLFLKIENLDNKKISILNEIEEILGK